MYEGARTTSQEHERWRNALSRIRFVSLVEKLYRILVIRVSLFLFHHVILSSLLKDEFWSGTSTSYLNIGQQVIQWR